jgi:hypothetical protein
VVSPTGQGGIVKVAGVYCLLSSVFIADLFTALLSL